MTSENVKRELKAIFYADVKEYGRLMGEDEVKTVQTLNQYRGLMVALILQFQGRVVDSPGDNLLAEFVSVVNALECAVKIQKELKVRNDRLPHNCRMDFRIGINLGDVIEDGARIYGDGVNVADRLEGLADGGGICISGTVYDHVENKFDLKFKYLGKKAVKNIRQPIRVYRVMLMPDGKGGVFGRKRAGQKSRASFVLGLGLVIISGVIWSFFIKSDLPLENISFNEKLEFQIFEKPSIAVLPFKNLSKDPMHDHFADGIADDLVTNLSKISNIRVNARNSSFAYKRKPMDVMRIANDLNVQYLLEGSVRHAGERLLINIQLIDTFTGHYVWADRYDRNLRDLFTVFDEITGKVLAALQIEPSKEQKARLRDKGSGYIAAFLKNLQKGQHQVKPEKAGQKVKIKKTSSAKTAADSKQTSANSEIIFWDSIKDSEDIKMFEAYLKKFPNGIFAELATINITKLSEADINLLKNSDGSKMEVQAKAPSVPPASTELDSRKLAEDAQVLADLHSKDIGNQIPTAVPEHKKAKIVRSPSYRSTFGSHEKSPAATRLFKTYQYHPDYHYYYAGFMNNPDAVVGIHNDYQIEKYSGRGYMAVRWRELEPTAQNLEKLVKGVEKNGRAFGALLLDPAGQQVGILYTFKWRDHHPQVRMLKDKVIQVVPRFYAMSHKGIP